MAFICYKGIACKGCKYYKYDEDREDNACFALKEMPLEEYVADIEKYEERVHCYETNEN
jgi:hypothetical protein